MAKSLKDRLLSFVSGGAWVIVEGFGAMTCTLVGSQFVSLVLDALY